MSVKKNTELDQFAILHGVDWLHSLHREVLFQIVTDPGFYRVADIGEYYINPEKGIVERLGTTSPVRVKKLDNGLFTTGSFVFNCEEDVEDVYYEVDVDMEEQKLFVYHKHSSYGDPSTEFNITNIERCNPYLGQYNAPPSVPKFDYNKE